MDGFRNKKKQYQGKRKMIFWVIVCVSGIWLADVLGKDYRLPTAIKPEYYDLEIITYISEDSYSFSGRVMIKVKCLEETNQIILHSKNLTIHKSKVIVQDTLEKKSFKPTNIDFDEEKDFLIITVGNNLLTSQSYNLFIAYDGILDDNLDGYYKSSYYNSNTNKTEWMAVTQFEATSARKAFPCFDEPAMKAIFKISLGRPAEYTTISNMPLIKSDPSPSQPGGMIDHYAVTPPMSTYLIAFIVSKFVYKQSEPTPNNITFRIYTRQDAIEQADFAKEVGPKALSYFENYFKVKYALPKQDMIAIPDFSAGAMENWGLITYRETLLLFDNMTTSEISKYSIANVICHELAHQWFGNLVTMKWWTDLWLNEGFATQMAAIATHGLFPEWNTLDYDTVINVLSVFSLDSLKTSHPISVPVQDPKQIGEIFDIISYKKGSFLLRMLIHFLGEETFKKGITRYLNKHAFNNAQQDDLWAALTKQAHMDGSLYDQMTVKEIMDTWTLQTGYPVLNVVRNYACNTALVMQERFLYDNFNSKSNETKTCWWVPITLMSERNLQLNNTQPRKWLTCPCGIDLMHEMPNKDEWVLFNVNISALYRINYDELNWRLLINALQNNFYNIPVLNRVQLIDDSAALAWTGKLKYDIHFNILSYLVKESDFLPWRAAISNFDTFEKLFRRTSSYGILKTFIRNLLKPIYGRVGGYETKTTLNIVEESRFQSIITMWGCNYKVSGCIEDSKSLFNQWQTNSSDNKIPKDLRGINYCVVLRNGGESEWNYLWSQYQKSNNPAEKQVILVSLGCSRDIWMLVRYLEWSISSDSGIRKQDIGSIFTTVASNEIGYYVVKHFLYQKLPDIYNYLGSSTKRISRVFMSIALQIVENSELNEFKQFLSANKAILEDSAQTIRQAIETAEIQVEWFKRNNRTIIESLKQLNKKINRIKL
ncbi:hypothetical protein RN001_004524 [Aquatica leii]|uniref:Aminopeptidase n=1 Tax=Aquatica leii TaxID=1421715 RepID=A0AAN7SRR3_9COLE|nr:hypothetical protein RN001_004524 [Aquatica leii]